MGCMMLFVQGLRGNRTEEGTPHVVGVHVESGVVEGTREEMAASKRWRRSHSRELRPHTGCPLQADSNASSLSMAS